MNTEILFLHSSDIPEALAKTCHVAAFIKLFADHPPQELLKNIHSDFYYLKWEGYAFPVTVTNKYYEDNSYVASIYNTYICYAQRELTITALSPFIRNLFLALIKSISLCIAPSKLDKVVYINNWLVSTNLYPSEFTPHSIETLIQFLTQKFNQHAIVFRSLNNQNNASLIKCVSAHRFSLIGSRQVYLFNAQEGIQASFLKRRDTQNDLRMRLKSGSYLKTIKTQQCTHYYEKIESFYTQLYIEKYCGLNPQYTAKFIKHAESIGMLETYGIYTKEGIMIGAMGLFARYNIMTSPVVGYNALSLKQHQTYRQIMSYNLEQAQIKNLLFNASSGGSQFKLNRGATATIEYSAFYINHLPPLQRYQWRVLQWLVNKIALPFIQKNAL